MKERIDLQTCLVKQIPKNLHIISDGILSTRLANNKGNYHGGNISLLMKVCHNAYTLSSC
jgi:hypothetical protein